MIGLRDDAKCEIARCASAFCVPYRTSGSKSLNEAEFEGAAVPFIKGRFYINPAAGWAIERARASEPSNHERTSSESGDAHWVTINHRHVLIDEGQSAHSARHHHRPKAHSLSPREKIFLDKYYEPEISMAKAYGVDPKLVLGVAAESGFATTGTYLRTGDAFGMTGGNTKNMTQASSPEENVEQFFDNYGKQIRGAGSNTAAFLNGLQGLDAGGAVLTAGRSIIR